jgi:hypothetical protein
MNITIKKYGFLALIILLSTMVLAPMAQGASDIDEKFNPQKISSRVLTSAATVAWSADGTTLAYITARNIHLYNSTSQWKTGIKQASYIIWQDKENLLAIYPKGNNKVLGIFNTQSMQNTEYLLPKDATAIYPLGPGREYLVTSFSATATSIGVRVASSLYLLDTVTGATEQTFKYQRIIPRNAPAPNLFNGWSTAGPNPVDEGMILIEFRDPPALPPYIKATVVDAVTGEHRELYRGDYDSITRMGCWGASGNALVITTAEGNLRALSTEGLYTSLHPDAIASIPACNPASGQIYTGGYLLGESEELILKKGRTSIGVWNPSGTDLAINNNGTLRLLTGVGSPGFLPTEVPFSQETIKKIRTLRDLLRSNLISADDYQSRKEKLLVSRTNK